MSFSFACCHNVSLSTCNYLITDKIDRDKVNQGGLFPWKDWYLLAELNLTGNDINSKAKPWDTRCYREPKGYFLFTHCNCLSFSRFDFFFFCLQVVLLDTARELCLEEKSNDVRDNSNNVRNGTATVIKMTMIIIKNNGNSTKNNDNNSDNKNDYDDNEDDYGDEIDDENISIDNNNNRYGINTKVIVLMIIGMILIM